MSEGTRELWGKLGSLDRENNQDKWMQLANQLIKSEQDPKMKANAYYELGTANFVRGENERAIENLTEAIKLEPQHALAYGCRGAAYSEQENYEEAFMNFGRAIEIDPKDANSYVGRGIAYSKKGDHQNALVDLSKVIEIYPTSTVSYTYRGTAYHRKGDNDQAIQDLTKAIRLDPKNGSAFRVRGLVYLKKKNYGMALDDLASAAIYKPNLKFKSPVVYVASRIYSIYNTDNKEIKNKSFHLCLDILRKIQEIQKKQFYSRKGTEVAHYTSLHILQKLSKKTRFRLYNASYMNDPDEGRVFFEVMKQRGLNVEKAFYGKNTVLSNRSPAYIGSFIKPKAGVQKDALPLWRTYGEHDADEAAGSCLIFQKECFAENNETKIGSMRELPANYSQLKTQSNEETVSKEKQNTKLPLYKIIYTDSSNHSYNLRSLRKSLKKINTHINSIKKNKKEMKILVCELLDSIRFLFKSSHYKEEKEIRVIYIHHKGGEKQVMGGIKVDVESTPPRFYVETPESVRFSEVILGPRAKHVQEWKQWIKKHDGDIVVKKSGIKYGRQDS